jgi:putative ABC transport system permease protein
MGKTLLVYRLAVRDIRNHAGQAVLFVVAIAAAAATLTMALAMNGVTSHPYAATRAATKGPDVVAYLSSVSQAKALVHASGVRSSSGPYPVAYGTIAFGGRTAAVFAEGRSQAPAAVDQPDVTAGSWVRPGGVVLERTFAEALGAGVGDVVTLDGLRFAVAGIAVSAAQPPYPDLCSGPTVAGPGQSANACPPWFNIHSAHVVTDDSGQIWMTEADALGLVSKANPLTTWVLNLKLSNPADAQSFIDQNYSPPPSNFAAMSHFSGPTFATWEGIASEDALLLKDAQGTLEPGVLLLALLSIASVTVLVGRRLSEYAHRVGLLKAVGGTPTLVAAMFLAENLVLALLAAAIGMLAGWLAAPLLTNPGAALIGTPGAPSLTAVTAAEVVGVALAVSLAATLVPAIRAARTSTVNALNDVARPPKRRGALIGISSRLPLPALFGLRLAARRPRRALLSAANVAVTVMGIVAVLCFHADVNSKLGGASSLTAGGLSDPVVARDEQMLAVITVMLILLAALNATFTTWATVTDARRASALMRALGTRTRQVSTGLVITQELSAVPGAIVGIPLGYLLFRVAVKHGTLAPPGWLALTVLATLLAMAGLTLVPARIGARQPVAEVLQAEAA